MWFRRRKDHAENTLGAASQYSSNIAFLLSSASKALNVPTSPQAAAELLQRVMTAKGVQCSVSAPGYLNFPAPDGITTRMHAPSSSPRSSSKKPSAVHAASTQAPSSAEEKVAEDLSLTLDSSTPALMDTRPRQLTVTQVPAAYTDEAFQLYKKYQSAVHGDGPNKNTPRSYSRFLCHSTLTVTATLLLSLIRLHC